MRIIGMLAIVTVVPLGLDHLAELPNLTQLFLGLGSPLLENGSDVREGVDRLMHSKSDLTVQ